MKKILKSLAYLMAFAVTFSSCSKSTDTGTPTSSSITITLNKQTISADGFDEATVTVKDESGADVTANSSIIVNGSIISGNKISVNFGTTGTSYEVYAAKNNAISNKLTLNFTNPGPSKYSTKVIEVKKGCVKKHD